MSEETETVINEAIHDAEPVRDPLDELVEKAKTDPSAPFESVAVTQLIALKKENPAAFERLRVRFSETKVRLGELDKLLGAKAGETKETSGQGQPLSLPEPEPWHEPVDGAALLDDIAKAIRDHVILPDKAPEAVALWVVMTYGADIFDCLPRLYIHSPERECGKTTLLNCVSRLAWHSLSASSITSASTFRVIEKSCPTLCLDEADTFLKENLELRGVINSGHTRATAFVIRNVGEDHEPRQFSTFTPIAIAGIGRIHDTTESRSVIIAMRRKMKAEKVKKLRDHEREPFATLARKIRRWVNDNRNKLVKCVSTVPEALGDRAADNWLSLLAIADTAGGGWPERSRKAAVELATGCDSDTASFRTQLLADIKAILNTRNIDKISSKELIEALVDMEGHPWAEWRQGKPLSANTLARLLAVFSIVPGTIRLNADETCKGYKREQFIDAFERYLSSPPPDSTVTPSQSAEILGFDADLKTSQDKSRDGSEIRASAMKTGTCDGVTVQNSQGWEAEL